MAAKYKIGDVVKVPGGTPGAKSWWMDKDATVRAVFEETGMYEVLFMDAQDFDFIEEDKLVLVQAAKPVPS
jgi:uncharacterized protein YodC (DUF2158 family)